MGDTYLEHFSYHRRSKYRINPTHCLLRSLNLKYRSLQLIEVCAFTRRRRTSN